ncbi:MAG: SIS domain-containing protein, partial [Cetobacterium sp.]
QLDVTAIVKNVATLSVDNVSTIGKNLFDLTKGDLVFVISHSGKSSDVYSLLKAVKKREIKIITLTQFSPNPVKDLGDVKLSTVVEKNSFRSTALSSRIAQMTVIDIIYVKLIQKNKKLAEKYIGDAIEMVKEIKMK